MSTNDQPHAEVTEEMRQFMCQQHPNIGHPLIDYSHMLELRSQELADFCAKREALAVENFKSTQSMSVIMDCDEYDKLIARESLLTASNKDLARQVEEKDAAIKKLDHEGFYQQK